MIRLCFLSVMMFQLTACAPSLLDNQDVRCPFADRGGCYSMEKVNQMVSEGRYTEDGEFVEQASAS